MERTPRTEATAAGTTRRATGGRSAADRPPPPDRRRITPPAVHTSGTVRGTGTLARGVECPIVRLDDGRAYTLQGSPVPIWQLEPGRRVRVVGSVIENSTCQQGTTLQITEIEFIGAR